MPTYLYVCKRCDRPDNIFHTMNDTKKRKCQKCGGRLEKKITGGAGVVLKGKGFYANDYPKGKTC